MKIQHFQPYFCILFLGFVFAICGCEDSTIDPSDKAAEVVLTDYVLSVDETWDPEKTYIVHGTLEIPSDTVLEIPPGTVVKFGHDAQIKVSGLDATLKIGTPLTEGTLDAPVYLTSDNANPQKGDWNGIQFEHTRDLGSFLRGTVIEYAKIALDINSTSISVIDCTLRANKTAIVLDGSNSLIRHNAVLDNEIGIYTVGRQNRPVIEKNNIANNDSGIICENVQSIIQYNNFEKNGYALRLQVKFDLEIPDNWWGTIDNQKIDEAIVDSVDTDIITKMIGTVSYESIAVERFADAGPRE